MSSAACDCEYGLVSQPVFIKKIEKAIICAVATSAPLSAGRMFILSISENYLLIIDIFSQVFFVAVHCSSDGNRRVTRMSFRNSKSKGGIEDSKD